MRLIVVLALLATRLLAAQTVAAEIAAGDSLDAALQPAEALRHYQAALAQDSTAYDALWRASRALINIAKQIDAPSGTARRRRDSLYLDARALAERAVAVAPDRADGHAMVAQALGRLARTRGGKERVRFAEIIYDEATRAIALDSTNDIAYHVLGAWHAEVLRLSSLQRFFAKTLFGAGVLSRANWAAARHDLERAVALRPGNIFHHLELAEIETDMNAYTDARAQLGQIPQLTTTDVLDDRYRARAAALLDRIRDQHDRQ
jgi:tetratricopeptide (TPR) repeat protein